MGLSYPSVRLHLMLAYGSVCSSCVEETRQMKLLITGLPAIQDIVKTVVTAPEHTPVAARGKPPASKVTA